MKSSKGIISRRQNYILKRLEELGEVRVEDLAREMNVSLITIRRDLNEFEAKGLVERYYGGARYIEGGLLEDPSRVREDDELAVRKRQIARAAASYVSPGDTIFINSSTTAYYMFEYLKGKAVTIITNNANAIQAVGDTKFDVVFTGGEINSFKHSMVGEFALEMLRRVRANKCFIGVSGISENGDISTAVLQETMINVTMMKQSNHMIAVLADSRKIGVPHNFTIGHIDQVTHVITDSAVSEEQLGMLSRHKAEIVLAK